MRRIPAEAKCDNLVSWVWEHAYDLSEFVSALKWCGFTLEETKAMAEEEMWIDDCNIETIYEEA